MSRGTEEIARILTSLHAKAELIAASLGDKLFRSQLLFIDPDRHYIVVAGPDDAAAKAAVLARSRLDFVAQFGGWHIEFAAGDPQTTTLAGKPAIRLSFPQAVIRHQRRAGERTQVPAGEPLRCIADAQGFAPFEGKIVDIARGGIGLLVYPSDITLEPGTVLKGCRVQRPDKEPIEVDLEVRYSTPLVLADGTHAHRSGCVFLNPTREVMELIESFSPAAG
ncbi:MAG: flagellar brake protein [Betaproteobacteria bacterium]|nr:flagellar brake protein [Betaproteobacteria bacterium]